MRTAQIRSLAILGNKAVDVAFNDLRMVGHDALDAHVELKELKTSDISPSNRDEIPELRRQAFGSYDDNDKLGQKQIKAIKTLEDELRPLISLQQA